ncbi:hypothetical protein L1987_75394 [Smallanthus sonchifolius]|uniref:Uncharacterized protein n=1 Tax=Smallanthus sonchifolius TaxID=185202 RepID=A0ACB9A6L2_9ASTR|nr:hypothetical protein L1987_75394 [Smallanthus sonchifolius]
MANLKLYVSTFSIFLLAISLRCATGTRILVDTTSENGPFGPINEASSPNVAPEEDPTPDLPTDNIPNAPAPVVSPISLPTVTSPVAAPGVIDSSVGAAGTSDVGLGATSTGGSATSAEHPSLSFFMHDVLGGSHATSRVVTGIVATSDANVVPFSRPNSQVFPVTGGIPLGNINGIVNNNNLPFLAGFNGNNPNNANSNTVLQNTRNNNVVSGGNNLPFVTAGVIGRGQGFYLSSSLDGSSHTFALTTLFQGSDHEVDDTISLFGVHRTASEVSHIAIIGGTGKYEDAKGYATIESLPQVDEHTTDGVKTIVHVNVYLTTP